VTVLPIIERELREKARRRGTYWTRFVVALTGVLICLPQMTFSSAFGTTGIGRSVFNGLVWGGFILCCCSCLLTADVISSERRDGTLGLLLLTRVRRMDILLGKFGSAGLTSLMVVLALLPMLLLPLLDGGVTGAETLRKSVGLLETLFFALAVGLFASSFSQNRAQSVRRALALTAVFVLLPLIPDLGTLSSSVWPCSILSPVFLLTWELSGCAITTWWVCLVITLALTWLLLLSASAALHRTMREEGREVASDSRSRPTSTSVRNHSRGLEAGADAVEWLFRRQPGVSGAIWAAVGVSTLYQFLFFWIYRFVGGSGLTRYGVMLPSLAINLLGGTLLAWSATRFFVQARQAGELELLLTTPIGAQLIVSGQWQGWKRLVRWPVVVLLTATTLQMVWVFASRPSSAPDLRVYYAFRLPLSIVHVLLEFTALSWTGMWFGLKTQRPAAAIGWTVALVRGVPYLIGVLVQTLLPLLTYPFGFRGWASLLWLTPHLGTLPYFLWLIRYSKRNLATWNR
jgi:ABC-type transport system involved in multi-copper enzyme maturation permease subunit